MGLLRRVIRQASKQVGKTTAQYNQAVYRGAPNNLSRIETRIASKGLTDSAKYARKSGFSGAKLAKGLRKSIKDGRFIGNDNKFYGHSKASSKPDSFYDNVSNKTGSGDARKTPL